MKCNELSARLDDLMDGAIGPEERAAIDRHLSMCSDCRAEAEAVVVLRRRIDGLARWVDPPRDLWPDILERIDRQKVERGRFASRARRFALVAAAAAAVAAAVLTAYTVGRRHSAPILATIEPTTDIVAVSFEPGSLAAIETEFRHARTELMAILGERRHELSPETLQVVDSNLQLIDAAIDEITLALGRDPDNPQLSHRLTAVYRRQIALLRTATRLPSEI